jgi:hypothetical protein
VNPKDEEKCPEIGDDRYVTASGELRNDWSLR